jgi:hypothetical protein
VLGDVWSVAGRLETKDEDDNIPVLLPAPNAEVSDSEALADDCKAVLELST